MDRETRGSPSGLAGQNWLLHLRLLEREGRSGHIPGLDDRSMPEWTDELTVAGHALNW